MEQTQRQDFAGRLDKNDELEITVTGRLSARETTRPVWFVREDIKIYLLPVTGSDTEWYKNLRNKTNVTLAVKGASLDATATPISDIARVNAIVEKFRAKYGSTEVSKYYSKFDVAVEVSLS